MRDHHPFALQRTTAQCVKYCTIVGAFLVASHGSIQAQQMVFPDSTWQTATPESMLVDSAKLQTAVEALRNRSDSVDEMLVVRNGRVIWQGDNTTQPILIWSGTKSFVSTVLGLMIDDGLVTLDTLAQDDVPALAEMYPDVTLAHFASNTSGYMPINTEHLIGTLISPTDPFTPGPPLFSPPGSQYAYPYCAWDMLALALTHVTDEPLQDLFARRIAGPIAMNLDEFAWEGYVTSDGLAVDGGDGWEDSGVIVSARNAARLGHLFLNRGKWDDQQLISSDWVDQATQIQVPSSLPLHPKSETNFGPGAYGYGWWVYPNWYEAWGHEENRISVSPDTGFVVARLGTQPEWINWDEFKTRLLNATIPAIWDEQGDGRWDGFDPDTGKPRWKTESGLVPDIYPTSQAIVRSDTITVASDLSINRLDIETGEVKVNNAGALRSGNRIVVDPPAVLTVDGIVDARMATVNGQTVVSREGSLEVDRLTVDGNGELAIYGTSYLDRLTQRSGRTQLFPGAAAQINKLYLNGGSFILNGEFSVGLLRVGSTFLDVRDSESPYPVTERFELDGDSDVRFLISDESWDSFFNIAEGIVPVFAGDLMIDFAATANPKQLEGQTLNLFDWGDATPPSGEFSRVTTSSRVELDLSRLYSAGEVAVQSVLGKPSQEGDFNGDTVLDANDTDALSARIRVSSTDTYYDMNSDGQVTQTDLGFWIRDLKHTWFGDADLNGEFNSSDMVQVFANGKYETGSDARWKEGDWNADFVFNSSDMVAAFADGGYEKGLRPDAVAVPEPTSVFLLSLGLAVFFSVHRHWCIGSITDERLAQGSPFLTQNEVPAICRTA